MPRSPNLALAFTVAFAVASIEAVGQEPEATSAPVPDDSRIRGYVEAWIRFSDPGEVDRVTVEVERGVVTLSGAVEGTERRDEILATIRNFEAVVDVVDRLEVKPLLDRPWKSWSRIGDLAAGRTTMWFPRGDVFSPPLADPKQPRSHATVRRTRLDGETINLASVSFGDTFGIVRWPWSREGDGHQLGVGGAVFAVFNLDAESFDLVNADYLIGIPWSVRWGGLSGRVRLFHESSHLGDEFLLNLPPGSPVERLNLSYEAVEALASYDFWGFRVYGGASYIVHSSTDLDPTRAQAGAEWRSPPLGWASSRFVAAVDFQEWEETDWDLDFSTKAGLRFESPFAEARSVEVLFEYFNGHAPYGQFFEAQVEYLGLGVSFGL